MNITKGEAHQHKFKDADAVKVLLRKRGERLSGYDMLKQRVCSCGEVETYDLERVLVS